MKWAALFCSLFQRGRCLPWAAPVPVLMNSLTGTQLYPCIYILFCSCFGIRSGWEDGDKCHGTDTYGICHLSPFREKLPVCLPGWRSLSADLYTTWLQHGHMGKSCQHLLSMARVTIQLYCEDINRQNILPTLSQTALLHQYTTDHSELHGSGVWPSWDA